jgi:hypothetical protein
MQIFLASKRLDFCMGFVRTLSAVLPKRDILSLDNADDVGAEKYLRFYRLFNY